MRSVWRPWSSSVLPFGTKWLIAPGLVLAFGAAGCHTDMWTQPKALPQQSSDVLPNGQVSQLPVEGTVPRGGLRTNEAFFTGFKDGKLVAELPETLTIEGKKFSTRAELATVMRRGKDRFEIFCTHCHGAAGDGKGMIAQRGLELRRPPATYHSDRLREIPIGHFFDVMTHGYGAMFSYASRVTPDDRWAIAAYIRALQLSQNARGSDLPEHEQVGAPNAPSTTEAPGG
jgi:mono/diheme cytochrome c family protein